ncbi:MAG TPA: hypothetical protein VK819_05405 [Acidobacteriaceae bacterium]|jgi:hypothetical protein|nr:hypothetical protein [Acidobacteriaceae bacterium]
MQFSQLVGRRVVVLGPKLLDQEKLETVTLVGVDAAGIWIESEDAANRIAEKFRVKPAKPSAFFIPFASIITIIASCEEAAAEKKEAA